MDFVAARRKRCPGMHIYHYAHYENAALKELMQRHGVKESAVDDLLREKRLVDLYKVVREGLRIATRPSTTCWRRSISECRIRGQAIRG